MDPAALWDQWLGNAARAGYRAAHVPSEPPQVVWEAAAGPGVRGTPVLTDRVVLAPGTDRELRAFNRSDGTEYWARGVGLPPGAPLVVNGRVFLATESLGVGELRALRLTDGGTEWREEVGPVSSPIVFANDTVFGVTDHGFAFAVRARDGRTAWKVGVPARGRPWGPIMVGARVLLVAAADTLFSLDRRDGHRVGQAPLSGALAGLPALQGDTLVVATTDGSLLAYSVRAASPDLLWETAGFETFAGGPAIARGEAFAVTHRGEVVAVRLSDGRHRVLARLDEPVHAGPTLVENGLLVGTLYGRLVFLDYDGQRVWTKELEGSVTHPAAAADGAIFVPMYGPVGGFLGTRPNRGKVVMLQ